MKQRVKKINKMLSGKPQKRRVTKPQKALWAILLGVVTVKVVPEAVTQIYNYINRADPTQIKLPQKEDLFPSNVSESEKQEQEKFEKEHTNYSYDYLKLMLRPQIEKKLGFSIEGDFDVLGVLELNLISDGFESKDTRLCILIKPENGKVFCVSYNNNYAQTEIEKSGTQSDAVSSLVAHLQSSSIEGFDINPEYFEDTMQNLSELNMVLVGGVKTYIEKNGEKSYMLPVFVKNGDQICLRTFKCLQSTVDKAGITPEEALEETLYGDEGALMQEYTNKKQQDLSHLNNVLDAIRNNKSQKVEQNKDLFPEDIYGDLESEQSKG